MSEVLKDCKKFTVERVITPSLYWMTEYDSGKSYKKEIEHFEHLLAKYVEKWRNTGKIPVGEVVAIREEGMFHRGLVTDVFNRNSKVTYWVLLVDHGNVIETTKRNIFVIKNKELKDQKLGAFEVSIHHIQPAVVDLECEKNFLGGIFKKRISVNWSSGALQFVRDLIEKNPCVFVKSLQRNERIISGEVYFVEEHGKVPISLGQKLCDKGFAVFCDASQKLTIQDNFQGDSSIEEKIPLGALFREIQNSKVLESLELAKMERKKIGSLNDSADCNNLPIQRIQNNCSSSSSSSSVTQSLNYSACSETSPNSCPVSYSSSWILKKCQLNKCTSSAVPCENYKKSGNYDSEQVKTNSSENCNKSIFRVVQRSIELFNKHKQSQRYLSN